MEATSIIVSNRLPFQFDPRTETLSPGSGGLVTAVRGARFGNSAMWIGSIESTVNRAAWEQAVTKWRNEKGDDDLDIAAVFLDPELYDAYYNGLCNDVLWPLLHYEQQFARYEETAWEAYKAVNSIFAERIAELAPEGASVWVHDYHLFLLPQRLRELRKDLKVGFFLHVPFPSSELFRQLPVREELLEGVLEADLVGFHDHDYLRHFCAAVQIILGLENNGIRVERPGPNGHVTRFGVFPVAIDTEHFASSAASEAVAESIVEFRQHTHVDKIMLGVDRLDYTKGIDLKLMAYRSLLERHPELRGKVQLLQLAVPSRTGVKEYVRLRQDVERLVGEINGRYGKPGYVPVNYLFTSVPFDELLTLYRVSDVLLVTSKRDGMNLVAPEYISAQDEEDPGVVCLSEFAGSISVLPHVIPINPWDVSGTADRLYAALQMPRSERIRRHRPMIRQLKRYTASEWAASFMRSLAKSEKRAEVEVRTVWPSAEDVVSNLGDRSLLLLLDFDGTLAGIVPNPPDATMTPEMRATVTGLAHHPRATVILVSGRDGDFLAAEAGDLPVGLAPEHGGVFRGKPPSEWTQLVHSDLDAWYPVAARVMEDFAARTPGSHVEYKRFAVTWHYRRAPRRFADHQARRLQVELSSALSNLPAQLLMGHKVIEARAVEANKGQFFRWLEQHDLYPEGAFVLAMGDDTTDEDLFAATPKGSVTIRVGRDHTNAAFRLPSQEDVQPFLQGLLDHLG